MNRSSGFRVFAGVRVWVWGIYRGLGYTQYRGASQRSGCFNIVPTLRSCLDLPHKKTNLVRNPDTKKPCATPGLIDIHNALTPSGAQTASASVFENRGTRVPLGNPEYLRILGKWEYQGMGGLPSHRSNT